MEDLVRSDAKERLSPSLANEPANRLWGDHKPEPSLWHNSVKDEAGWAVRKALREQLILCVQAWRDAAVLDGWSIRATYEGHEAAEQAFTMERGGFKISGLARPAAEDDSTLPVASLHCWGPDGAAVALPDAYDFAVIKRGFETCGECGAHPVETKRYAFANRCCAECGPRFMASLPSNWCD